MSNELYDRVIANPKFKELTSRRNRFAWILSVVMLVIYYTFVLMAAYSPASFATPLGEGMTFSMGLTIGFGLNMFCFLMTGIYVRRANSEFDDLNRAILEEVGR